MFLTGQSSQSSVFNTSDIVGHTGHTIIINNKFYNSQFTETYNLAIGLQLSICKILTTNYGSATQLFQIVQFVNNNDVATEKINNFPVYQPLVHGVHMTPFKRNLTGSLMDSTLLARRG